MPGALTGITLAGERRPVPGDAGVLVIAATQRDVARLQETLRKLNAEGACKGGCLGLVAMGSSAFPTRAIAAGRVRGNVSDPAMRAQIMPVFERVEGLLQRFAPDARGEAVTVVRLR